MPKNDKIWIFIDEIYSKPPLRTHSTNKIVYNHIDEIWSTDLADFSDYKTTKIKRFRYVFILIVNFSNCFWAILLKEIVKQ